MCIDDLSRSASHLSVCSVAYSNDHSLARFNHTVATSIIHGSRRRKNKKYGNKSEYTNMCIENYLRDLVHHCYDAI